MTSVPQNRVDIVKYYFEEVDEGRFPVQCFTSDFEFFFPKFGVGRGMTDFGELATGMLGAGMSIGHCRDTLAYTDTGDQVIVEGATHGTNRDGTSWKGCETPGGRFCSIFDFNEQGLISRMFIYADPDYASVHKDGFHWNRAEPRW